MNFKLKRMGNRAPQVYDTDIVIIGGGLTGVGVARDASLRGYRTIVLEQAQLGSGTSGHFHGVLHSGVRYVVDDPQTAYECYRESQTLRRVASAAIEETGGLLVALNSKEVRHADKVVEACRKAGIPIEELGLAEARRLEPALASPHMRRVFRVPEAVVDGHKLIALNRQAAESSSSPAQFWEGYAAIKFDMGDHAITAVEARNLRTGQEMIIRCRYAINAAGVWAGKVSKLAGARVEMVLDKGSMVTMAHRPTKAVLYRCRPPADGDIIAPSGECCILGTTSVRLRRLVEPRATPQEIALLLKEADEMVPGLAREPAINAYAGLRPLFSANMDYVDPNLPVDRSISRSFAVLDHEPETGIANFVSVVGGKATVYRKMAEKTMDAICAKDGRHISCSTGAIAMDSARGDMSAQRKKFVRAS